MVSPSLELGLQVLEEVGTFFESLAREEFVKCNLVCHNNVGKGQRDNATEDKGSEIEGAN